MPEPRPAGLGHWSGCALPFGIAVVLMILVFALIDYLGWR